MKTIILKRLFIFTLAVALGCSQASAQIFSSLQGFGDAGPYAHLILSGNTLYGTTAGGGSHNLGTVFAIDTDGTGFTNLYSFTGGSDGAAPGSSCFCPAISSMEQHISATQMAMARYLQSTLMAQVLQSYMIL